MLSAKHGEYNVRGKRAPPHEDSEGRGCTPEESIAIAQVQVWAVQNGFSDLLEEALVAAGERGWIDDNSDPNDGKMRITREGWENGNA
jgi:hypothetical protein